MREEGWELVSIPVTFVATARTPTALKFGSSVPMIGMNDS